MSLAKLYTVETPRQLLDSFGETDCVVRQVIRCPFGPIVEWVPEECIDKCTFCSGDGEVSVDGDDHSVIEIECPRCDGTGEGEGADEPDAELPIVWADAEGNIVEPDLIYPTNIACPPYPSTNWLMAWARQKQEGLAV